jgi:hypothetical protein
VRDCAGFIRQVARVQGRLRGCSGDVVTRHTLAGCGLDEPFPTFCSGVMVHILLLTGLLAAMQMIRDSSVVYAP